MASMDKGEPFTPPKRTSPLPPGPPLPQQIAPPPPAAPPSRLVSDKLIARQYNARPFTVGTRIMLARTLLRFVFGTVALSAALAAGGPHPGSPVFREGRQPDHFHGRRRGQSAGLRHHRAEDTAGRLVPRLRRYVEKGGTLKLVMRLPAAGDYELRLLSANSPYPTLRQKRDQDSKPCPATLDFPGAGRGRRELPGKVDGAEERARLHRHRHRR